MKPGDKVKYSDAFCRSIGASCEVTELRGIVVAIAPAIKRAGATIPERVRVQWTGDEETATAFIQYLTVIA